MGVPAKFITSQLELEAYQGPACSLHKVWKLEACSSHTLRTAGVGDIFYLAVKLEMKCICIVIDCGFLKRN